MSERVLIFEDDVISSLVLEKILQGHGYESLGRYESADELSQLAEELKPDLILLDIMLKGQRSGLDAAAALRSMSDVPILFLSALSDQETRQRVDEIQNAHLLNKPYVPREILQHIKTILEEN